MDFLRNTPNLKNYELSKLFRCITEEDFINLTSSDIIIVGNNDISLNLIKILLNYDLESIKLIDNETSENNFIIDKTQINILNKLKGNFNDNRSGNIELISRQLILSLRSSSLNFDFNKPTQLMM